MKRLVVLAAFIISFLVCNEANAKERLKENRAFFVFRDASGTNEFVIMLRDRSKIRHARAILAGQTTEQVHVGGIIIKERAWYNPKWSYHIAPSSIDFFDFAIEVCDASIQYVEEHLNEVGGAFLPGSRWCPWSSELVREVGKPKRK